MRLLDLLNLSSVVLLHSLAGQQPLLHLYFIIIFTISGINHHYCLKWLAAGVEHQQKCKPAGLCPRAFWVHREGLRMQRSLVGCEAPLSPSPEGMFSWADRRKALIRTKNKILFLNQEQATAQTPLLHVPVPGGGWDGFPCPAGDLRMGFTLHLNPPVLTTTRPWAAPKAIKAWCRTWACCKQILELGMPRL